MGVYAVDAIPNGAVGQYKGIPRSSEETNMYYAWAVVSFDPQEGDPTEEANYMYYVDATDFDRSNWTRYVNCGIKDKFNNMEQTQIFDKIYYIATSEIEAGAELFVDYGEEYRKWNLGLKGNY